MHVQELHGWDVSASEAVQIQNRLRERLILQDDFGEIRLAAGCDTAFDMEKNEALGGVIVYEWPALREIERKFTRKPVRFPYVPGLLAFREIPVLAEAITVLQNEPDLFFFDGHGFSHPRGLGIASHMGILLEKPTIGCAKSLLCGSYEEPGPKKGDRSPLLAKDGREIGTVLRTRDGVQPIFVSAGHRIRLETAVSFTLQCLDGTRIPKPTHEADHFVETLKLGTKTPVSPVEKQGFLF